MLKSNSLKKLPVFFALLALVLASLACGSPTPEVTVPEQESNTSEEAPAPAPAATEAPKPLGSARSNPAPLGSEVAISNMTIVVTEVVAPANNIVAEGNMFNSTPEPGNEYIFVNISVMCTKSADETCNLSGFEFSLIDSAGITHDAEIFIAGVSGLFEGGEFYGGSTKTGYLPFLAPESDLSAIIKFEELFGGEAYLAIQ